MAPQPVKIRTDFELTCFEMEGIDAIKAALVAGEKIGTEEIPIKINLIAPPIYVMSTTTLKKKEAFDLLGIALAEIKKVIKEKKGKYDLKEAPRIIGEKHEIEMDQMIKDLEHEKRMDDGEEDEDDVEGMGVTTAIDKQLDEMQAKNTM